MRKIRWKQRTGYKEVIHSYVADIHGLIIKIEPYDSTNDRWYVTFRLANNGLAYMDIGKLKNVKRRIRKEAITFLNIIYNGLMPVRAFFDL